MISAKSFDKLRKKLDTIEGRPIVVTMRRGHKRAQVKRATLVKTYPGVFTLRLYPQNGEESTLLSFNYADILTKAVEISLCS